MILKWSKLKWHIENSQTKIKYQEWKSSTKCLPTRSLLATQNSQLSAQCPRCAHIFQCLWQQNKSSHRNGINKFRDALRNGNTHILIINTFDMLLSGFHHGWIPKYVPPPMVDIQKIKLVQQIFEQQKNLGNDALVRVFCREMGYSHRIF